MNRRKLTTKYLGGALCAWMLTGCATSSLNDVDVSKAEATCARQCTMTYSSCVSTPTLGGFQQSAAYSQCKEALKLCVKTCPPKEKE